LRYFDRNGTHLAGCILSFRTIHFGVHFENRQLPRRLIDLVPELRGASIIQPPTALCTERTQVELRIAWPPGTALTSPQ
jgi:hypothetical protein